MTESGPPRPAMCPPWLRPDTHAAMQAAFEREMAAGRGPSVAAAAACAVLLESVAATPRAAAVIVDGAGSPGAPSSGATMVPVSAPSLEATPRRMDEGEAAELVAALTYALRFDARGKPRRGGGFDFATDLAAEWLAEHLQRSNFVLSRRRPGVPHRAG